MAFFPPQLFSLSSKSLAGGLLELWTIRISANTAAALITIDSPVVPVDRMVILTHCDFRLTPGAAQTFVQVGFTDVDPQNVIVGPIYGGPFTLGVVATSDYVREKVSIAGYVLGPGHRLQLIAAFSAGAAANIVEGVIQGWQIPRGDTQLAGTAG